MGNFKIHGSFKTLEKLAISYGYCLPGVEVKWTNRIYNNQEGAYGQLLYVTKGNVVVRNSPSLENAMIIKSGEWKDYYLENVDMNSMIGDFMEPTIIIGFYSLDQNKPLKYEFLNSEENVTYSYKNDIIIFNLDISRVYINDIELQLFQYMNIPTSAQFNIKNEYYSNLIVFHV